MCQIGRVFPNGERVSGSEDNTVRIWDAATGQLQQTLEGPRYSVWSVAFSRAASAWRAGLRQDGRIWDARVGFIPSLGMQAISCTIFRAEARVLSFGTFFPTYPVDHCQLSKSLP